MSVLTVVLASGWEPPSFFFEPGLPRAGDRTLASVDERYTRTEQMLLDTIEKMKAFPDWRFEIRAFTDDRECVQAACQELALRRATVVRDWMIEHGAPAASLKPLKAYGSAMPLDDNGTRNGRRINRRVELAVELPETRP